MKSTGCQCLWRILANGAIENTMSLNCCIKRNGVELFRIEGCDTDEAETWSIFDPILHTPTNFFGTEKNSFSTSTNEGINSMFSFNNTKNGTFVTIYLAAEDA